MYRPSGKVLSAAVALEIEFAVAGGSAGGGGGDGGTNRPALLLDVLSAFVSFAAVALGGKLPN